MAHDAGAPGGALQPLRWLTLVGPATGEGGQARPLWTLTAAAPRYGWENAVEWKQGKKTLIGVTADHVHSIRVLDADLPDGNRWRQPRLLGVHLLLGAQTAYRQNEEREELELALTSPPARIKAWKGKEPVLRTLHEEHADDVNAPFVHVVAEPLSDGPWELAEDEIALPPLRLVAGRVGLDIVRGKQLAWLKALPIQEMKTGAEPHLSIWLVPDGIEFDANLPFPGTTATLPGRVLLTRGGRAGTFDLTLLHPLAGKEETWWSAWRAIVPRDEDEKKLLGLKFAARRDGPLPVFRWTLKLPAGGSPVLEDGLRVPGADFRIALVSPPVSGDVDGVADLRTGEVRVREAPGTKPGEAVEFHFCAGVTEDECEGKVEPQSVALDFACSKEELKVGLAGEGVVPMAADASRLAAELRQAYGIDPPPAVPHTLPPGYPAGKGFDRPLIPAFVPLEDGWLQFPVPNLGAIDTGFDPALAGLLVPPSPPAVFEGYFRMKRTGRPEGVLSAHASAGPAGTGPAAAPWSVTVQRATGVVGRIGVQPRAVGKEEKEKEKEEKEKEEQQQKTALLKYARVSLYGVSFAAQGLVWVSADRPDALEALPRLGAGPGAFIDVGLESRAGDAILEADIRRLSLRATPGDPAALVAAEVALAFQTAARRWKHEVAKPREARQALLAALHAIEGARPPLEPPDPTAAARDDLEEGLARLERELPTLRADVAELRGACDRASALIPPGPGKPAHPGKGVAKVETALAPVEKTLPDAATDVETLLGALGESDAPAAPHPWPCVVWRRHPSLPLVAGMPMTRAAAGAVRPLESRDLIPYAALPPDPGKATRLPLATLLHDGGAPFARVAGVGGWRPIPAWPWHDGAAENGGRPDRGIAFSALGLPGVELRPVPGGTAPAPEAIPFEAAVRYDLPALDEAFATATLPPLPPPEPGAGDGRIAEPPGHPATALDWPQLTAFWAEQERKLQNARAADSYLTPFLATGPEPHTVEVTNLVAGLAWTPSVRVDAAGEGEAIPFGTLWIDPGDQSGTGQFGNEALKGCTGTFTPDLDRGTLTPGGDLRMIGFSPASFDGPVSPAGRAIECDNRLAGADRTEREGATDGLLLSRSVSFPAADPSARLLSLAEPLDVAIAAQPAPDGTERSARLSFWFKDVLFEGFDAVLEPPDGDVDFDAWYDPRKLAGAGFEWRLAPADEVDADAGLRGGRSEIPFFGFRLEPLRLTALSVGYEGGSLGVASASILCRLSLGERDGTPDPGANCITLTLVRGTWNSLTPRFEAGSSLRFTFAAHETDEEGQRTGAVRRAVVEAEVPPGPAFGLSGTSFSVAVAGVPVELGKPAIALAPGMAPGDGILRADRVVVSVGDRDARSKNPAPGKAALAVTWARLESGLWIVRKEADVHAPTILQPCAATVRLHREIRIVPRGEAAEPAPLLVLRVAAAAPDLLLLGQPVLVAGADGGLEAVGRIEEGDETIAVRLASGTLTVGDGEWTASLALLARLATGSRGGKATDGDGQAEASAQAQAELELVHGHLEGFIVQGAGPPTRLAGGFAVTGGRLDFSVSSPRRGEDWEGSAVVAGRVTVPNAIRWPALRWDASGEAIPVPREMPASDERRTGRTYVYPELGSAASHTVTWIFAGHRLPLGLASSLAAGEEAVVWVAPVMTRHELVRESRKVEWAGIETIAVGSPAALVPKLVPKLEETDSTTFAARYRHPIVAGKYGEKPEPGMLRPGWGAVSTVLQGAMGTAFRKAFWEHAGEHPPRLLVAGGFLGLLRRGAEELSPLFRLPVLAGLDVEVAQTGVDPYGVELAWADGPAAALVALTRAGAPSPANATLDALSAAILAGSRSLREGAPGEALGDPVGALLVEQSFIAADLAAKADLTTAPFFLASAVGVERMLAGIPLEQRETRCESLSLFAGYLSRGRAATGEARPPHPLAAAIALRQLQPETEDGGAPARLLILGDRLTRLEWPAPRTPEGDGSAAALVTGLGVAHDPDLRAALIIETNPGLEPRYRLHLFPRETLEALDEPGARTPAYPDHGRGWLVGPGAGSLLSWLAAPLDRRWAPVRDDASGLAGLTRLLSLPAQAGKELDLADPQARARLLWLSQTQVPLYLPLHTTGLKGPPIGWLTPAPPETRLPLEEEVASAMRGGAAPGRVQPFLPADASTTSVGERPGVLMVRHTRLLSAAGEVEAFDPLHGRFGRPAQGGSTFGRTLRVPRPGPLPPNTGDEQRDRRIQASSVHRTAFEAVVGSADVVQGGSDGPERWSITAVAAPELASTVSDRWDGSIRLVCAVRVEAPRAPEKSAAELLIRRLLKKAGETDDRLASRALLQIGGETLSYRSLCVLAPRENGAPIGWTTITDGVHRGVAHVVLDVREPATAVGMGAPSAEIARALSVPGPLPPVELQWTVHPSDADDDSWVQPGTPVALSTAAELPAGDRRAPVTLRFPLYPVTAERGSLPLAPATLLFTDPAYNRDLAGQPLEDRRPLALQGAEKAKLPEGRGALLLVLSADRGVVNRRGAVTFMLDARLERSLEPALQACAENAGAEPAGDLMKQEQADGEPATPNAIATLQVEVLPKAGTPRVLHFKQARSSIGLEPGTVYELGLTALVEEDDTPARLAAGDILRLKATLQPAEAKVTIWSDAAGTGVTIDLTPPAGTDGKPGAPASRSLLLVLTDEPVVEPPPALYAAFLRTRRPTEAGTQWRIAVPLHAQSPLPARVDLVAPARDFRQGRMHRHATFVWTLLRPPADFVEQALYVLKGDRNGQTYLPESVEEFAVPELHRSE